MKSITSTKILKWGNSLGMRIPKEYADNLNIAAETEVDITTKDGKLLISPRDPRLPREYDLDELLSEIDPDEELPNLVDWGPPQGNEIW